MNEDFLKILEERSDSEDSDCQIYIGSLQFSYMGNKFWTVSNNFGGHKILDENVTREELLSWIGY